MGPPPRPRLRPGPAGKVQPPDRPPQIRGGTHTCDPLRSPRPGARSARLSRRQRDDALPLPCLALPFPAAPPLLPTSTSTAPIHAPSPPGSPLSGSAAAVPRSRPLSTPRSGSPPAPLGPAPCPGPLPASPAALGALWSPAKLAARPRAIAGLRCTPAGRDPSGSPAGLLPGPPGLAPPGPPRGGRVLGRPPAWNPGERPGTAPTQPLARGCRGVLPHRVGGAEQFSVPQGTRMGGVGFLVVRMSSLEICTTPEVLSLSASYLTSLEKNLIRIYIADIKKGFAG
ncbi:basic proline-rich protein-like isoform X2 [Pipra filicauda]|uniref:Basic proline-rich protein-like isoform X2 n=1 Tax=Pipra filicauda TaxID=649802 RepID=A0A7R5KPU1_9PASS|nr:basic proline-rich protein-like isoform X2 [Pipra filicauda]